MGDENKVDDITGKKVFFLYPTASVQNQIITELTQNEIEAYTARDHARLQRLLKDNPNSILYINIDEQMPEIEWEKWIATLLTTVPTIKVGIFSSNTDEELKNKFLTKFKIACGFFNLKLDMTKSIPVVLKALNDVNVNGRRKYLRVAIDKETNATINMPFEGDFLNGTIKDISIVGFSCVFERDPAFKKNTLHKDIQLRLQSILLKIEGVVFGSRDHEGEVTYVFIFTQRVDPDVRGKIRKFIMQNMQSRMDQELS